MIRVGLGQDSHPFLSPEDSKSLMLGGVKIAPKGGFKGNSDGDVTLHSICNALSSAIGGDSLSVWADKMCLDQGIKDSSRYVEYIIDRVVELKYSIINISISIEAKKTYLKKEEISKIKNKIAALLKIEISQVGLTFTSGEGLTSFGQGKGMQALTIVSIVKHD